MVVYWSLCSILAVRRRAVLRGRVQAVSGRSIVPSPLLGCTMRSTETQTSSSTASFTSQELCRRTASEMVTFLRKVFSCSFLTWLLLLVAPNATELLATSSRVLEASIHYNAPVEQPKSLLWRVQGGGMKHSSYLYGTMHSRDARVYEFADSVLPALERCSVFAVEQRIDTLVGQMVREMYDTSGGIRLRDVVQGKKLDSLSQFFAEKLGVPARMVPTLRVGLLMQLIEKEDVPKARRRPTFLDAWLLGLARSFHKDLRAMEPYDGMTQLLDKIGVSMVQKLVEGDTTSTSESASAMERMLRAYRNQEVDSLYALMTTDQDAELMASVLESRNNVMVQSFDSLHRKASLFAAVGAGHLGGTRGLVALLREKGYTVEAVAPVFTGVRHRYDTIDVTANATWYEFRSETNGFVVKMPAPLAEAPLYKQQFQSSEMDVPQCADMVSGLQFITLGMRSSAASTEAQRKSLADVFAAAYYENVEEAATTAAASFAPAAVPTSYKGHSSYEYLGPSKFSELLRMRIVVSRAAVYVMMILGVKENIHSSMVDVFLNSLEFPEQKRAAWIRYTDTLSGVSFETPGKVLEQVYGADELPVYSYSCTDLFSGSSFLYQGAILGDKLPGNSLTEIMENLSSHLDQGRTMQTLITHDTIADFDLRTTYVAREAESGVRQCAKIYVRGRHWYMFMLATPDSSFYASDSARFFSSIQLPQAISLDSLHWIDAHDDSARVSAYVPVEPKMTWEQDTAFSSSLRLEWTWIAYDRARDLCPRVERYLLHPYTYYSTSDELLKLYLRNRRTEGDSMSSYSRVDVDGATIWDFVITRPRTPLSTRFRVILRGVHFTVASLLQDRRIAALPQSTEFFRSITLPGEKPFHVSASKFDIWFSDLESKDPPVHEQARAALRLIDFAPGDSLKLRELLLRPNLAEDEKFAESSAQNYDTGREGPLRAALLEHYLSLCDSSDPGLLSTLYQRFPKLPAFQQEVLRQLTTRTKSGSHAALFKILKSDGPRLAKTKGPSMAYYLSLCQDDLPQAASNLSLLQDLMSVEGAKQGALELITILLDSSLVKSQDVNIKESDLAKDLHSIYTRVESGRKKRAKGGMVEVQSASEQEMQQATYIMTLAQYFERRGFGPGIEKELRQLLVLYREDANALSQQIMRTLLVQKRPLAKEIVQAQLERPDTRYETLLLLDEQGLRSLADARLFRQSEIALAYAWRDTQYDDEVHVDSIEVLGEQILRLDSSDARYFLLRCRTEMLVHPDSSGAERTSAAQGGKHWYIALVGCFSTDTAVLKPLHEIVVYSDREQGQVSDDYHWKYCSEVIAKRLNNKTPRQ